MLYFHFALPLIVIFSIFSSLGHSGMRVPFCVISFIVRLPHSRIHSHKDEIRNVLSKSILNC
jgi:hypothetical protein